MRAATLFSGIGAPELACPHWSWLWHAEIEPFPSAVMAHHHPDSINLGDVLAADFLDRVQAHPVDVLVGGPPCQAFSVAGLRGGLADPRGNLSLRWVQIIHASRPAYALTENVPGWLNTKDNAFGCFLGALVGADDALAAPPGGGWPSAGMVAGPLQRACWRVLDAQYFGLAQRRQRVFVVSCPADGGDPSQVLFERKGVRGDTSQGEGAGERIAAGAVAGTLGSNHGNIKAEHAWTGQLQIAHSLRAEGFDASEDGTGRGTPIVPVAYACQGTNVGEFGALRAGNGHLTGGQPFVPVAFRTSGNCGAWSAGEMVDTLSTGADPSSHLIGFSCKDHGADAGDISPTLRSMGHSSSHANGGGQVAVAMNLRGRDGGAMPELADVASMRSASGGSSRSYVAGMSVRRLTPVECERLQGFPDGYTMFEGYDSNRTGKWGGNRGVTDGPRYRALGNSMAVPVVRWILSRIEAQAAAPDLLRAARQ